MSITRNIYVPEMWPPGETEQPTIPISIANDENLTVEGGQEPFLFQILPHQGCLILQTSQKVNYGIDVIATGNALHPMREYLIVIEFAKKRSNPGKSHFIARLGNHLSFEQIEALTTQIIHQLQSLHLFVNRNEHGYHIELFLSECDPRPGNHQHPFVAPFYKAGLKYSSSKYDEDFQIKLKFRPTESGDTLS